jgi:hypothetical protein
MLSQVKLNFILLEHDGSSIITDYTDTWYEGCLEQIALGFLYNKAAVGGGNFEALEDLIAKTSGLPEWWTNLVEVYQRINKVKAFL